MTNKRANLRFGSSGTGFQGSENNGIQRSGGDKLHSPRHEEELSREILSRMEIPFSRSKDESWAELHKKLMTDVKQPAARLHTMPRRSFPILLAAASLALLLSITAFLRYHTKTVETGEHTIALTLPDGSALNLSEDSKASWHPLWWRFNRVVSLNGEALFTVENGEKFTVASATGTTKVVGTTFSVTARSEIYRVACYEGAVKVTGAGNTVSATITAFEQVVVHKDGRYSISLIEERFEEELTGESSDSFEPFRSVPAEEVFRRIANHYGITIRAGAAAGLLFSGNLQFNGDPEKLLNAVCTPLELRYEKTADKEFIILQADRQTGN